MKFRIFDKIGRSLHYYGDIHYLSLDMLNRYNPEDFVVQKFTGKKDICGINIYEGDLVEFHFAYQDKLPKESFGLYKVVWSDQFCRFELKVIRKNWLDSRFKTEEDMKREAVNWEECPGVVILTQPLGNYNICKIIGNINGI